MMAARSQSRSRLMSQQHFVGLDVSVKETAICVVDPQGRVVHRATVESHPAVISQHLLGLGLTFGRVGLEAGPLSPWLYAGLVETALPAICVETRHMHAALSARINKTDRNHALGIAQMMRVGLFKPVHVKTLASQQRRLLLTSRKLLQRKVYDIENDLRGQLRNFGLKVGIVGTVSFEQRVRDLVLDLPHIAAVVIPLLAARSALRVQLAKLHKMLLDEVRADPTEGGLIYEPRIEKKFPRAASCRISLSSVRSAIALRSRVFSVSRSFSRLTWSDFSPPNSWRQDNTSPRS